MATEKHLDKMLLTGFAESKYPQSGNPQTDNRASLSLSKERLKIIMEIIDTELTEKQADCIRAIFLQNMSIADYAREQGINKSSACRRFHRGLNKLRKYGKYVKLITIEEDD